MIPSNLKVLAKFGLCSNCSQKLDECSLAHARKVFASARMLGSRGGGGGTLLYGLYRYVPRNRVWFLEVLDP